MEWNGMEMEYKKRVTWGGGMMAYWAFYFFFTLHLTTNLMRSVIHLSTFVVLVRCKAVTVMKREKEKKNM